VTVGINDTKSVTLSGGGSFHLASSANLLTLQAASGTATYTGANITFNGQDITLSSIIYVPALTLAANEQLTLADGNCTFTDITVGAGTFNANDQAWSMSGSWDNNSTGSLSGATATATFTGAAQTINAGGTGEGKPFGPVSISGTYALSTSDFQTASLSGAGSLATGDRNLTVAGGDLTIATLSADEGVSVETITVSGDFTPGTFTAENSTVVMNSADTPVVVKALAYYNLTLEKDAAANIVNLGSGASIGGKLTVTTGTLNQGGSLTVTGDIEIAAGGELVTGDYNLSAANITELGAGAERL
jgi:hypothetical protein